MLNKEGKAMLVEQLKALLTKAGLPEERELIGRKFAFTYDTTEIRSEEVGEIIRVSGVILGIQFCKDCDYFTLLTTELPKKLTTDTIDPSISFFSEVDNFEEKVSWSILFRHNHRDGYPDINASDMHYGDLDLL